MVDISNQSNLPKQVGAEEEVPQELPDNGRRPAFTLACLCIALIELLHTIPNHDGKGPVVHASKPRHSD